MAHLSRLLTAVVSSLLSALAFLGNCALDVFHADLPPVFDAGTSLHADQVQRTARSEVADTSPSGAMFTQRARDHELFIGDGFTYGGMALPI